MVKFAAAGYVCVDYYPDFNNRYYITGNGVDVLFNLLDIKKGKDMEASIISAVSDDEYGKEAVKMFHERNIDCSHLEVILMPEGNLLQISFYYKKVVKLQNHKDSSICPGFHGICRFLV